MKKLGIIVLAVVLIAALALPPVFGTFTERQVEARVAQLAEDGGWVDAGMHGFERGWFASTAKVEVALSPASRARLNDLRTRAPDPQAASAIAALTELLARPFTVDVRMSHGPVMLRDGVGAGFSRMTARLDPATEGLDALLARLDIPYLFEFRGRTGFDGVFRFDADIPPIDYAGDGDRLTSSGARLEGSVRGDRLYTQARAERLAFGTASWRLEVDGFVAEADNVLLPEGLVLGSFETALERVALYDDAVSDTPLLEALQPGFAAELARNGSSTLIDAEIHKRVNSLRSGETTHLEDASFGVTARNIDLPALRQAYEAARRGFVGTLSAEALSVPLLAASPTIALEPVRFHLNGEPFDATLHAEVQGAAVPAGSSIDLTNRAFWAGILEGTASVNLSKTLAEDLAIELGKMQLRGTGERSEEELEASVASQVGLILLVMSAQGFLEETGDNYVTEISYADGTLRVNGRELPLGLALR